MHAYSYSLLYFVPKPFNWRPFWFLFNSDICVSLLSLTFPTTLIFVKELFLGTKIGLLILDVRREDRLLFRLDLLSYDLAKLKLGQLLLRYPFLSGLLGLLNNFLVLLAIV